MTTFITPITTPTTVMTPPTASASQRALLIPELIEQILINLPIRDLLTGAQLTSRSFHTLITTSPTIQQLLFFAPKPKLPNPLSTSLSLSIQPQPNPLLCPSTSMARIKIKSNQGVGVVVKPWSANPGLSPFDRVLSESALRPEASWRKMLVVQPPVQELHVESIFEDAHLKAEDGVTMGMLDVLYLKDTWLEMEINQGKAYLSCAAARMACGY